MKGSTTHVVTEHVDVVSNKTFETTVKDLTAELGKVSTEKLMDRLAASKTWDEYAEQCADFAGRSRLIEVGQLNWGAVLSLAGSPMRARCFIVGNPVTARKLLAAGGPEAGLYLPTKILVFESTDGTVHVAYQKFAPLFAWRALAELDLVASAIDAALEGLASKAIH